MSGRKEFIPLFGDSSTCPDRVAVEIVTNEHGALLRIHGRIDIDSSPALRERLLALFEAPPVNSLNIDLSAVTHIDSSGVATLIEALRIGRSHKAEVRLQGLEGRLHRLFQSTGILALFDESKRTDTQSGARAV